MNIEYCSADRMSVRSGSGQFIAVVDLAGFTWSTCPSISMIKDTIGLLKKHYPYRLGGIFILNGGTAFNFIWNLLKPIMPKRALLKTFVLNKKEEYLVLNEHLGNNNFEVIYGGKVVGEPSDDVAKYFQEGFWYSNSLNTEIAAN